jgi:hypothetical protein
MPLGGDVALSRMTSLAIRRAPKRPAWPERKGDIVKKAILTAAAAAVLMIPASVASADTFQYNFCPGHSSCNTDLSEASLSFVTVDGTSDVNDYTLTVRFVGTLTNTFIDTIDFSTGLEFAALSTLTSAPEGTGLGDWTTKYDKLNASAGNNCSGELQNHLFVCSKSTTGNGPSLNGTNDWVFSVDFLGDGVLGSTSTVDLRARFVDSDGTKVGALMSPEHTYTFDTTGPSDTTGTGDTTGPGDTTGNVPEPAMLSLFGAALALGARRLRRR